MEEVNKLREHLYLIDHFDTQIISNKLPSNLQVLRVFGYNHCVIKLPIHESALLTTQEVKLFWTKARLPTQENQHCIKKVELLYEKWLLIKKNSKRSTTSQKNKEAAFKDMCSKLFDIAHANVLSSDAILEEDKQFLLNQREGLIGYMIGKEPQMSQMPNEETDNSINSEISQVDNQITDENISTLINESSASESQISQSGSDYAATRYFANSMDAPSTSAEANPDLKKQVMSTKLASALDAAKVSDRKAVHILTAACQALNINLTNVSLSRSTIRRFRENSRAQYTEEIQKRYKNIKNEIFTLHWDGKLLPSLTDKQKVDRLPVIITSQDSEILLGVPYLDCGTGKEEAEAIVECIYEWGVENNIEAICCDTEAVNTGPKNGASVLLEGMLGKSLLYFLCRHHIAELVLKTVFESKFGPTSGPNVPFFKSFQNAWNDLNKDNFDPGTNDPEVFEAVKDKIYDILAITYDNLEESHCREDYKELLELTTVFLGGSLKHKFFLRIPGAMHQARWMSKAIYVLKMFLLRKEFVMNSNDEKSCKEVCIFIVLVYIKHWFNTTKAEKAPNQDLLFIQELKQYSKIDSVISKAALQKIQNHLWYLTPEVAAMSFFDDDLSFEEKNKMRDALSKENKLPKDIKRLPATSVTDMDEKCMHDFITEASMNFFSRFKMQPSFLDLDSSEWNKDENYKYGQKIVQGLKVTNDIAERHVKLMTDFNDLITRDEDQKQYLLQVVKEYRKQFPNCNKTTLSGTML